MDTIGHTHAMGPRIVGGRYEVGRLLGTGGLVEAYQGHDRLLARRVAIKILQAHSAHDPAFLAGLRRDAQAAASLSHPNIVGVYDTGSEGDTWFIVTEYIDGRTLKDIIRAEGALYWVRAAEIGGDVASALSAAHGRGLVHRGVKPGNVMLTTDGKVKVTDFGIARASAVPSVTQAAVSTAQYIAPERAQGLEADARSDIYALGCCLYEMLTGQVPFSGPTPVAIAHRHMHEHPTPPRALNPDVPVSLERVCLTAMAKRVEDRYQTTLEMREHLDRVRAGAPPGAGIPLASRQTQALGVTPGSLAYTQTIVLDPRTSAVPGRAARYGGPGGVVGAPSRERTQRWRAPLLVLATLALTGMVAMMVVRAMEIPPVPTTTLPPITTLPPNTSPSTPTGAPTSTAEPTTLSGKVTVPDVIGMRASRATETLQDAGLKVFRQNSPAGRQGRGNRVANQVPRGGQQVPRDSSVVIYVGASDHGNEND